MPDTYAVIGNPIAHSKSPLIHAEFSKQTGQDMCYETILAPPDGFAAAIEVFQQNGGKGMNVTVPFKVEAYKISTRLTEQATAAQAVNTLVFDGNEIYGDNTDGTGLIRDIVANLGFAITTKRVLLCGAGGAARGIMLPLLKQEPRMLEISNRTVQKAHKLRQQFSSYKNVVSGNYADIAGKEFDLIINATSASLIDKPLPLPLGTFTTESLAYDIMYGNRNTPFLQFARQEGATYLSDGVGMLVEQAAESFFIWRGVRPKTKLLIETLSQKN
ncbi:MAG: shikimate dehydrogenase [Nitrosomonadaceae bacterium]